MPRFVSTSASPQGGKATPKQGASSTATIQKDQENRPFNFDQDYKQSEWNIADMRQNLADKKAHNMGIPAYRDAYQMALTMAQQSGARTEDEMLDAGDQILKSLLGEEDSKGISMRSIRNQSRSPIANVADYVGGAIDTVNNGIGGAIDWVGDNTIGNIVGAIGGKEAGDSFKNFASGEDVGGVLSAAEDIGLWFVNPLLAGGKAALDNRANIEKAITGVDPLTLQQVDDGARGTAAGAAAVDIALSSLPGMGLGKAGIRSGIKAAEESAEKAGTELAAGISEAAEKATARAGRQIELADDRIRKLAEERGIKVPKKLDDAKREDILKKIEEADRAQVTDDIRNANYGGDIQLLDASEARRNRYVDDALQQVKNDHNDVADVDFLDAGKRADYVEGHNTNLKNLVDEEQRIRDEIADASANPMKYTWTPEKIKADVEFIENKYPNGIIPRDDQIKISQIRNRKSGQDRLDENLALQAEQEAALRDLEHLEKVVKDRDAMLESIANERAIIDENISPLVEDALANVTRLPRNNMKNAANAAKRAKNAGKTRSVKAEEKRIAEIQDDIDKMNAALGGNQGLLERLLTWSPRGGSNVDEARRIAAGYTGGNTAPLTRYVSAPGNTRRQDIAGAIRNLTLRPRNAIRARTPMPDIIATGRGGTTQQLNEQAARLMSQNPKAVNKLREITELVSKNGGDAEKLSGKAKKEYEKLQKEYEKLVGEGKSYEDALEYITKMSPIGQAYTRAQQNALAENGSGLLRRYMGDATGALGRGVLGMGDQALQLGAAMGVDPATAMQDYGEMVRQGAISPALYLSLIAPGPKRFANRLLGTTNVAGHQAALPYHAARMNVMNSMLNSNPEINSAIPTRETLDWMRVGGAPVVQEEEA